MKLIVFVLTMLTTAASACFAQSPPKAKRVSTVAVNEPLYILKIKDNLYEVTPDANTDVLEFLDTALIEQLDVLKDAKAINKFGDKGKNGVLVIQLKMESEAALPDSLKGKVKKLEM
jgi:hypothetical protein